MPAHLTFSNFERSVMLRCYKLVHNLSAMLLKVVVVEEDVEFSNVMGVIRQIKFLKFKADFKIYIFSMFKRYLHFRHH